jgi:hypothetical protein
MFLAKVIGNYKYFGTEMLSGMWYQIIPRYVERETEGGICGERERGGR